MAKKTAAVVKKGPGRPRKVTVPERSVLRPMVRKGREGTCQVCRAPVSAHVDKRGQWLGCQSQKVANGATLILIPDRRQHTYTRRYTAAGDAQPASRAADIRRTVARVRGALVRYMAQFRLSDDRVRELSDRDRGIYRLIAKSNKGISRPDLLKAVDPSRTGIVDGAVRRLRLGGFLVSTNVSA
jgi:hypothetical protein